MGHVRGGIEFKTVSATRTRAERCCKADRHIAGAYDALVEVEGSDWLKEILADTDKDWRHKWELHHYMIYLDSAGCFELIAESFHVLPTEPGWWPEISPA
jgi:hypothetical protein